MDQPLVVQVKAAPNPPVFPKPQNLQTLGRIEQKELDDLKTRHGIQGTNAYQPAGVPFLKTPETKSLSEMKGILEFAEKLAASKPGNAVQLDNFGPTVISQPSSVNYPWRAIGKVFVGQNNNFNSPIWTGSGCLVGPNLLLTASHVIPWNRPGGWVRFVPAYYDSNEPYGSSYAEQCRGVVFSGKVGQYDYAICSLATPLGYTCGWLGTWYWTNNHAEYINQLWDSVGYPGDSFNAQVPMRESEVKVNNVVDDGTDGEELDTVDYAHSGWSGGPTWWYIDNQPRAVAVMSGWESFSDGTIINVASGGEYMVGLVLWAEQNWPPPQ